MKTKRVLLLLVLSATVFLRSQAQTYIGRQLVDQYPTTAWNTLTYGLTWLPTDYATNTTEKYPLIIFLHGSGEGGDGVNGLWNLISQGLPQRIAMGWDPEANNPVDGQNYKFIVVSPQAPSAAHWSYGFGQLPYILYDVVHRYRVDTSRVYVTGLSAGGAGAWSCVTNTPEFARQFAAILPVSAAGTNTPGEQANLPLVGGTYDVKVWNVCGANDAWYAFAQTATNTINTATPAPSVPAIVTGIPGVGHEPAAWNTPYDPSWRNNSQGLNCFEWLLKWKRGTASLTASAGSAQSVTLPSNSVNLSGSATPPPGNTVTSYSWSKVSGPAAYTIASPAAATTAINGLAQGSYVFRLTVTDNANATATADVPVTVNAAPNMAPTANAGTDQSVTLPVNTVTLNGAGTDADGTVAGYAWAKIAGPASYTIANAAAAQTGVSGLTQGVYQFQLSVTDNNGAIGKDTVQVTVNPAPNVAPTANAGTDQSITLPINSITLNGAGADVDGTIASYSWNKISGPASYSIASASSAQTAVNGLAQGSYQFELTVTDNSGATAKDTVQVTVNPPLNVPPVANAGIDQSITLPTNTVTLNGSGTDADGSIASYQWSKIAGPAAYSIASASSAQTTVTGLAQGIYQFELTVTDNDGATAKDSVRITVSAAPNVAPTANAGNDQSITLPVDSLILTGSGADADGTIAAYQWSKIAGPSSFVIVTATQAQTTIRSLVQGTYTFELAVTDNDGAIARDTVAITVNAAIPPNVLPVAHAGSSQSITLPLDSTRLQGSGTDADGQITAYHWRKISGPANDSIHHADNDTTVISRLTAGLYQYELTVTDDSNATARDTVLVTVNPAPVVDCHGVKRYMLPGSDGGRFITGDVSVTGWYVPVNPGDTLVLRAQYAWSYFALQEYNGTSACPIVVTNEGGQTWLTAGIEMKNCHHIKITGGGDANTYYGFRIYNPGNDGNGVALSVQGKSGHIEIERADVYRKTYGVWAKQDPLCDQSYNYPNYVMDSIEIHHSRFRNIGQDCIYAGNTDPIGQRDIWCNGTLQHYIPMRISNINIHHLIIDSCMRTGIQISGADRGYNQVHDNIVTRCGYEYNQQQGTGISIGGMTVNCHVYNNYVRNTFLYGILSFGAGVNYIEHNDVDSSGWLDGVPNMISMPCNILASTKPTVPLDSSTLIVRYNKLGIGAVPTAANVVLTDWGPPTWTSNNVVCNNTKLDGSTPADYYVAPTVHYINDCSVPLPNMPPSANAGLDITLAPPTDSTRLTGSGSDPDGTVVAYHWTKINGPSQYTIAHPDSSVTDITHLVQGVYTFRLTVTDNGGLTATDDIQINVAPPNVAPIANAGGDQIITLPTNSTTLVGSGFDPDGSVASFLWTKISGPASYSIASPNSAQTAVSGLVQGVYQFELRVIDNNGVPDSDTINVTVNPAPPPTNIAPTVNAGDDQTITLPTDFVNLNAVANDVDGSVVAYQWTKVSGPAAYSFGSATSAQTMVSGLVQGMYRFELKVTDNQGATATDTVTINVNHAPNVPPVANAGNDITITLPTNSTTLTGSGTDVDGMIASYSWNKISGPASYSIASAANAQTVVFGLIQGVYQFELIVTDNDGATSRDTVQVTVNPFPNVAPTANAGTDQSITLPVNSTTLNGSGADVDGTIVSYSWNKISGPASYSIASAANAQTVVFGLAQGVYQFELIVTDDHGATGRDTVQVTVNPAPNVPPVASAGNDQSITLPVNGVTLNGNGTDADGSIASYHWTKISGPAAYSITSASSAQTAVTGLTQGLYQFELTVTDNSGATAKDTMQVTVNPAPVIPNIPPVVNAGTDQILTLPVNNTTLNGVAADADGTIASYQWTKISGPAAFVIANATSPQTGISGLVQGLYAFELAVTDNNGATARDTVQVTVNPAPNIPPVANAGNDQVITLPTNTVTLNGSGTDADGTVIFYQWTKISGPGAYAILNPNSPQTTVRSLVAGTYQFALLVTDNQGASARDTVTVYVNAAPIIVNIPPVANAGNDQTITLPVNGVTLTGSGTDADGTIVSYQWTKVYGPASYSIAAPGSAQTSVAGLAQGVYRFELKVTDNGGAVARDTMTVTVLEDTRVSSSASLYPNPATSVIHVKIDALTHRNLTDVKIYDMRGVLVYSEEFLRTQQVMVKDIDVTTLIAGTYLIVINADINKSTTLKFVKQ